MFNIVEKNQKLVKWILITITLSFVLWGIGSYIAMGTDDGYVAKIGDKKIYSKDVTNALASLNRTTDDKIQVLFGLINRNLLINNINDQHMRATQNQLQNHILSLPFLQESGEFSLIKYKQFLQEHFLSAKQFEEIVQEQILLEQTSSFFKNSYISSNLFKEKLARLLSKERKVSTYSISPLEFYSKVEVTESEAQTYYRQNIATFNLPQQVRLEYINLKPEDVMKDVKITTEQITSYLSSHKDQVSNGSLNPAKALAILRNKEARIVLKQKSEELSDISFSHPKSLKEAASHFNLTINTSNWVKEGESSGQFANPRVQEVIFNKDSINKRNNSDIIENEDGSYSVYRVMDYKPQKLLNFDEVKDQVYNLVKRNKAMQMAYAKGNNYIELLRNNKLKLKFSNQLQVSLLGGNPQINMDAVSQIFSIKFNQFPSYVGGINSKGEFVIYKVEAEVINDKFVSQNAKILDNLEQENAALYFTIYMNFLHTKYKVEYKTDRLN